MTLLGSTLVLYLVVGIGVAVAVYLSWKRESLIQVWFRMATAVPFWPLYLHIFLAAPRDPPEGSPSQQPWDGFQIRPTDDMSAAIAQVDAELEGALSSLDGWAEDVLAREKDRIRELRDAWNAQADRVREIDRLLALPQYSPSMNCANILLGIDQSHAQVSLRFASVAESQSRRAAGAKHRVTCDASDSTARNRLVQSQKACQQNIERLRRVRQRAYDDLFGNLAWVRELVSMIHLAKFTGAPASRAEELVAQIAAAVEGLSDLTWREEATASAAGSTSNPG